MTKQERLAALEMLLEASSGHIERAWAYDHYAINCDGVKGLTIELEYEIAQSVGNEGDVGLFGPLQYQPYYHIAFDVDSKNKAKRLRKKLRKWLYAEIAKLEQPAINPKEVIEAAAADGAAMDAAESLLDREQMRKEIMGQVTDFTSAIRHLYKALDAGYAKDEEIAALKRENEAMLQQHLSRDKATTNMRLERDAYIEQLENDVKRLSERLNERKEEIRTLNGVIAGQVQDFSAMEASRDEYKTLYQEALAAAERQRISENKEEAK